VEPLRARFRWFPVLIAALFAASAGAARGETTAESAVRGETTADATGISYRHGIAYLREPSYPADFPHFGFVNPDAPKGGTLRYGEMGNWDSFNEVAVSGRPVSGVSIQNADPFSLLHDTLLTHAVDTPSDRYGRLAEGVAVAEDGAWIAFRLRDGARWHDGRPITVDDYVFSFDVYKARASPTIRLAMAPFDRIEVLNDREIRYWVLEGMRGQPALPLRLGSLAVLPKHYWENRDITRPTLEPPLGSGPYRIGSFKTGRKITFERVEDYWGRDLPVNRGRYNFDRVVYDYFRDDQVLYEAVKGDLIDLREETVAVRWATGYDTPARRRGDLVLASNRLLRPAGLWWPIFWNQRVPRLQDVRVREALYLLRDGDWSNRVLSYDFWDNPTSFFHDSEFAHRDLPSERELALLEPIREQVPPRVFTEPFTVPVHAGKGWHRDRLRRALELFAEAGWVVRDGVLVDASTGEPFTLRLLAVSPALASSFIPYVQVLKKVGIAAQVTSPEVSSWLHRSRTGDFDGGALWFMPDNAPTLLVGSTFSSRTLGDAYSPNWAGIRDPAVDKLIGDVQHARTWEDYVAALRALDRVLLWNFYYAPAMSRTSQGLVYWNRFGRPDHGRLVRLAAIDTWWSEPAPGRRPGPDLATGGAD
jgi:microcin C transport system substrate-binding protein